MAVFIYEKDAFQKIVAVEGEEYTRDQKFFGSCSFSAFYQKWQELHAQDPNFINAPEYFIEAEWNSTIYGLGGWNRYLVRNTGEIFFVAAAGSLESIKRAKTQGFQIWG